MNFNPYQNNRAGIGALGPVQAMSDRNEAQTYMANGGQMFASGGITRLADGGALPKYKYDPVTQTYVLAGADDAATAMEAELLKKKKAAESAGGSGSAAPQRTAWDDMTSAQRAAYFADNPRMGQVTRGLMGALGRTGVGAALQFFNPQGWGEADAISRGFDPKDTSFGRGSTFFGLIPGMEAVPKAGVDVYGYGDGTMNTNYGGSLNRDTLSGYQTGQNGLPSELGGSAAPGSGGAADGVGPSGFGSDYGDTSMGGSSSFDSAYGYAQGGLAALARGGMSHLGDYSDGGRFLRNADGGITSDGISDSIPASIGGKRPARLAENEFVIPARIVSELGNGSSEAGARRLYAMMDRIQKARGKTVGKGKVAVDSKAEKYLPA
jgi:hypothetical protein